VVALSLGGLRRRIEALMVPDSVDVVLHLDGLAEASATGAGRRRSWRAESIRDVYS